MNALTKHLRNLIISLLCIVGCGYLLVHLANKIVEAPVDSVRKIADDVAKLFGFTPTITSKGTVVLGKRMSIMELATGSQEIGLKRTWTHTWGGSSKEICSSF